MLDLDWIYGRNFLQKGWWNTGTGCPERWYMPVPGNIQGQVGQGSEQPGLVEDVPAHCRRVGLADL